MSQRERIKIVRANIGHWSGDFIEVEVRFVPGGMSSGLPIYPNTTAKSLARRMRKLEEAQRT